MSNYIMTCVLAYVMLAGIEISPVARKKYLQRIGDPEVRKLTGESLGRLAAGIQSGNGGLVYRGEIEWFIAGSYGRRGIGVIDWTKPPVMGVPERRYLKVLENTEKSVARGDLVEMARLIRGVTVLYGSNGDNGGPPCNPEILWPFVGLKKSLEVITNLELQPMVIRRKNSLDTRLKGIMWGFREGDREEIYRSVMGYSQEIMSISRGRRTFLEKIGDLWNDDPYGRGMHYFDVNENAV